MTNIQTRNAQADATARLDNGQVAAVLEPSPPAVNVGPWFADDPTGPARHDPSIVSPLPTGETSWNDAVRDDPDLASFAREHWLANHKPLPPAPPSLPTTRKSLNALAFYVISPARHQSNGKIALRWTKGGFGTPFFGSDRQVRVEGDRLVLQEGATVSSERITTLRDAGAFVGVTPGDTRVQLWAEHFDPAIELGDADAGSRASYGASPGDAGIPSPYLYVAPWTKQSGEFWNASFGAALALEELRASGGAIEAARTFFATGRALLS